MGYRHSKSELLAAAVEVAQRDGLGAITFGRVARQLGIADRTVVYYFPTKEHLLNELMTSLGAGLIGVLERAFGDVALPGDQLARRAWTHLATDETDPVFRLFFEAVGLSMAGIAPFDTLVPMLIDQWTEWLTAKVEGRGTARRAEALRLMAQLDGLLLLRLTAGPAAADVAARAAGIVAKPR